MSRKKVGPFWSALALSVLLHVLLLASLRGGTDLPGGVVSPEKRVIVVSAARLTRQVAAASQESHIRQSSVGMAAGGNRETRPVPGGAPRIASERSFSTVAEWEARSPAGPGAVTGTVPESRPAPKRPKWEEAPADVGASTRDATVAQPAAKSASIADSDAIRAYRLAVAAAATAYRDYPAMARERGWQGVVGIMISTAPGRGAIDVSVSKSSGVSLLDQAALRMMRRAAEAASVPDSIRMSGFMIELPVDYRLDE